MISAIAPSLPLVLSSLDYPDARTLADQLDGELASIYGGPTTGRDIALSVDFAVARNILHPRFQVARSERMRQRSGEKQDGVPSGGD